MLPKSKYFVRIFNFKYSFLVILLLLIVAYVLIRYDGNPANDDLSNNIKNWPASFGFGKKASVKEVSLWDIDVRPDGKGLPAGSGNVASGKMIYNAKCMACHGTADVDYHGAKLPAPALFNNIFSKGKTKTIGNYWPYATTIFDYVRHTMPYNAPGTLTDDEVYSITAYLLNENKLVKADAVLNAKTLPQIKMPAQKLFVADDRNGGPEIK